MNKDNHRIDNMCFFMRNFFKSITYPLKLLRVIRFYH